MIKAKGTNISSDRKCSSATQNNINTKREKKQRQSESRDYLTDEVPRVEMLFGAVWSNVDDDGDERTDGRQWW